MKAKMNRRQRGFSLVEVMVSVLVLSGGLLGLAFLQAQGMKFNAEAYQRTQATVLAYDMIDRLRANPAAANAGAYVVADNAAAQYAATTTPQACDTSDGSVSCNEDELAAFDLFRWYQAQQKSLALDTSNYATIQRAVINSTLDRHTITMFWVEQGNPKTQQWEVRLYVPPT
ncbi:MAG: type IV pilus modification protein PilV [Candidatus Muproteobacteria bacterium RBG_16_64_11]|uniref:Type IV pilus modification protein PilV n=1 Tax=Candidatus Muproteobacteria bacterium RBG_16_64_11 TaxID=1817758 RepID=A0A1F6TE30_9PROT|nr:MAG: type IV pilus modification protein PilV [Candidatus Muproteobacteria bacterium RBG_16_64_11]